MADPDMNGTSEMSESVAEIPSGSEVERDGKLKRDSIDQKNLQRMFTLSGLKHPGGWRMHPDIVDLLLHSSSFSMKFDYNSDKMCKVGSISFVFANAASARDFYIQAMKIKIEGEAPELKVDDAFYEPADCSTTPLFDIPQDESVASRVIYALDLLNSTDKEILSSFFEKDQILNIQFLSFSSERQQAEILMASAESATDALEKIKGYQLDDGEETSVLRLLNSAMYKAFADECRTPKPFVVPQLSSKGTKRKHEEDENEQKLETVEASVVPEISEEEVVDVFNKYIDEHRINWAELEDAACLYNLCDAISAIFNGLPDSILKPAMLQTLNKHLAAQGGEGGWMRNHLEFLLGIWKREITKDTVFVRDSMIPMQAPDYSPSAAPKKKKGKQNTRAGKLKMSIGSLLKCVRQKISTEAGELEVEEDEDGIYTIGGEELSFESYGRMTRCSEPDVVSIRKEEEKPRRVYTKEEKKEWREKKMAAKKLRLMNKEREEMRKLEEEGNKVEEVMPAPKPPKVLDEGEIDSEEEKKEAKKKKKKPSSNSSSSGSSSSSSSGSDDDSGATDARARRRNRRKNQRRGAPTTSKNKAYQKIFENRQALCAALPMEQKMAFARILREVMASSGSSRNQNFME